MLTHRQRDCLRAIDAHFAEAGRSPSLREIAVRLKIKSLSRVQELVSGLVERGFITRSPYTHYGLERVRRLQFYKFNEETKALEPMRSN